MTAPDLTIRRWEEAAAIARPLSPEEREALRADIATRGVIYPIVVLPDGRIVDGHHRWEFSGGNAPIQVLAPMTDQEALYLAGQFNYARRHLDRAEWDGLFTEQERRRAGLVMLKVKTQAEVAAAFGVTQSAISKWKSASKEDTVFQKNTVSSNEAEEEDIDDEEEPTKPTTTIKDHREALTARERKEMTRLYWEGAKSAELAVKFNVAERTVRRIANGTPRTDRPKEAAAPPPPRPERTPAPPRMTRSTRVYDFSRPLTAPVGATQQAWTTTILGIIEFTKALRDQGVRPLVRTWSPRRLDRVLANLDTMIGQIQQFRAEVAAAVLADEAQAEVTEGGGSDDAI